MKDVEEKDLILHGLKTKEEVLRPIVQAQKCTSCGTENAPIAVYCTQCGSILTSVTEEKTREQMQKQAEEINNLKKSLAEAEGLFSEGRLMKTLHSESMKKWIKENL